MHVCSFIDEGALVKANELVKARKSQAVSDYLIPIMILITIPVKF